MTVVTLVILFGFCHKTFLSFLTASAVFFIYVSNSEGLGETSPTSIVDLSVFSKTRHNAPCLLFSQRHFTPLSLSVSLPTFPALCRKSELCDSLYFLCRRSIRRSYRSRSAVMPSFLRQYYCKIHRRSYCAVWAAV